VGNNEGTPQMKLATAKKIARKMNDEQLAQCDAPLAAHEMKKDGKITLRAATLRLAMQLEKQSRKTS
jgi:hypothetical protein